MVGSNPSCDIVIDDPFVSGRHCMIERRVSGAIVVRDSESRNGTYIDGNPVEGAELRVGSYLSIGRTTLVAVAATTGERPRAIELLRGRDPGLRTTIDQAMRAATTDCSVLILGETGTGKDLLARVIHESSRRANGPFVAVNCGAIPRELVASELFGHEKGAFTGASDGRDGFFVEANGGTLFLDRALARELPIELQANLLRVLETQRVRRVGAQSDRQVDAPDRRGDQSHRRARHGCASRLRVAISIIGSRPSCYRWPPAPRSDERPRRSRRGHVLADLASRVLARSASPRLAGRRSRRATRGPATCASCATRSRAR